MLITANNGDAEKIFPTWHAFDRDPSSRVIPGLETCGKLRCPSFPRAEEARAFGLLFHFLILSVTYLLQFKFRVRPARTRKGPKGPNIIPSTRSTGGGGGGGAVYTRGYVTCIHLPNRRVNVKNSVCIPSRNKTNECHSAGWMYRRDATSALCEAHNVARSCAICLSMSSKDTRLYFNFN